MRPMLDDADDGDITTLSYQFDRTSAVTALRLLREALERRFDDLIEFEDASVTGHDAGPTFNAMEKWRKRSRTHA